MSHNEEYVPFSQREGLEQVPEQLRLGEVSDDLRRQIDYFFGLEIDRETKHGYDRSFFGDEWNRVAMDFHVKFLSKDATAYSNSPYEFRRLVEAFCKKANYGKLFDFVEFFIRHPNCSQELKNEIAGAFTACRAAYRVVDGRIVAVGNEQQANALMHSITATENVGANAARKHLIAAGAELRASNWAGSVRESIHAVEAMARMLSPDAKTLGPALSELEKSGRLHGSLRSAFVKLYGYSSDEEGVRHALVLQDAAAVDEADALFMLGACASFVSYLIARSTLQQIDEARV